MEQYELNREDYEIIDRLERNARSIESLYKKMYNLEISGNKDEEFDKLLDYLNLALDVEERLYQEANLDYRKCLSYIHFIIEDKTDGDFPSDVESIALQNYNNSALRRVATRLMHKVIFDPLFKRDITPSQMVDLMKMIGMDNVEERLSNAIYTSIELQKVFEKDSINALLYFLNQAIYKGEYKDRLIVNKYYVSFLYSFVELDMIEKRFEIPDELSFNSKAVSDLLEVKPFVLNALKNNDGDAAASRQIGELLQISDEDYDDPVKASSSIIRQCILRAAFLFMDEGALEELNIKYNDFIESDAYLKKHSKDKNSIEAIVKCFRKIEKDKDKVYRKVL